MDCPCLISILSCSILEMSQWQIQMVRKELVSSSLTSMVVLSSFITKDFLRIERWIKKHNPT